MDSSSSPDMIYLLFLIVFLVAAVEMILLWRWVRGYYNSGIRVFLKEIARFGGASMEFDVERLNAEFHSSLTNPIVFKKLSDGEYGFRESMKIFQFRMFNYSPLMHGLIIGDRITGVVRIEGRLNWFSLLSPVAFFGMFYSMTDVNDVPLIFPGMFLAIMIGVYGVIYGIQRHRYNKVVKFLEERFSQA